MKRNYTFLAFLILSMVLVSLLIFDSAVNAQRRTVYDTGIISLGPNQILRVSVVGDWNGDGSDQIGFRRIIYSPGSCNSDGVCRMSVAQQTNTLPVTLLTGEAVTMDIAPTPNSSGVRTLVQTGSRRTKINVMIVDSITGQITSAQTGDGQILGNLLY